MPRKKCFRIVEKPPTVEGFLPIGIEPDSLAVMLHLEEYEAVKLQDYDGLSQAETAEKMGVSRPTVTRIYESARRKIAKALIEGLPILIEGGNYKFRGSWKRCCKCRKTVSTDSMAHFSCDSAEFEDII